MLCSRVDKQGVVSSRGHERAADESEALAQGCEVRVRPEKRSNGAVGRCGRTLDAYRVDTGGEHEDAWEGLSLIRYYLVNLRRAGAPRRM